MRITENANFESIRDNINRSKLRMEGLQQQTATLRKVNQPSDDPIGTAKILELRTEKVNNDQYQMNAKMAEVFLNNSDHALADMVELVVRAKEIAINQSSAASSSEDTRLSVAEEVGQLFQQAVSIGNRKVGDRYLFGGFKTQTPPISQDGDFLGDDGQMMVEIANDVYLSMNITGNEAFNTHPPALAGTYGNFSSDSLEQDGEDNINLFNELQNFRIALLTGDTHGIHETLDPLDKILSKLLSTRAKLGSRVQGLGYTEQAIERHNVTNAMLSSSLEDADMAQVMSDLNKEETVFRSSLASSKRLIQPTLLDFLR